MLPVNENSRLRRGIALHRQGKRDAALAEARQAIGSTQTISPGTQSWATRWGSKDCGRRR